MSAFICEDELFKSLALFAASKRHGSLRVDPRYIHKIPPAMLTNASERAGIPAADSQCDLASLYADILYQENIRSVRCRYPSDKLDSLPGQIVKPIHMLVTDRDVTHGALQVSPVQLLKMCDCLEYQSCETEDYRETMAFELLEQIRRAAVRCLPGYDDAEWGFPNKAAA